MFVERRGTSSAAGTSSLFMSSSCANLASQLNIMFAVNSVRLCEIANHDLKSYTTQVSTCTSDPIGSSPLSWEADFGGVHIMLSHSTMTFFLLAPFVRTDQSERIAVSTNLPRIPRAARLGSSSISSVHQERCLCPCLLVPSSFQTMQKTNPEP